MGEVRFKVSDNLIEKSVPIKTDTLIDKSIYNDFLSIKNRIQFYGYEEIIEFVKNNITNLLTSAIDKNPRSLKILTDRDFLYGLSMSNINLNREYINRFNRVYRAYTLDPAKNVIFNRESADLMYKLAYTMNKKFVDPLINIGIPEDHALLIIINRFSSTDERRNIRRAVRIMQHIDQTIMTEQVIVDTFSILFSDQLTNLFCSIMSDRFDDFTDYNEEYVYSTVSNALLDILNTMDVDEIKDIILEYLNELDMSGSIGRFRLNSINPEDYGRITIAIKEIEDLGIEVY